jgi:hypothetical protein
MNLYGYIFATISKRSQHFLLQDNAALAMIERYADAWEHNQFKDVIVRAANVEMLVLSLSPSSYHSNVH